jgi:hypothetical protein
MGHRVGAVEPAGHAYPAVQFRVQLVFRPLVELYRPAAHGVHSALPFPENVPAGQRTAVALVDPGGQTKPPQHTPGQEPDTPKRPAAH